MVNPGLVFTTGANSNTIKVNPPAKPAQQHPVVGPYTLTQVISKADQFIGGKIINQMIITSTETSDYPKLGEMEALLSAYFGADMWITNWYDIDIVVDQTFDGSWVHTTFTIQFEAMAQGGFIKPEYVPETEEEKEYRMLAVELDKKRQLFNTKLRESGYYPGVPAPGDVYIMEVVLGLDPDLLPLEQVVTKTHYKTCVRDHKTGELIRYGPDNRPVVVTRAFSPQQEQDLREWWPLLSAQFRGGE